MGKNDLIELTGNEQVILDDFIGSIDSHSKRTLDHLTSIYKNFVSEVGLDRMHDAGAITEWFKAHEKPTKPNNNMRYFLSKFAAYLGIVDGPLLARKMKRMESPKNPNDFSAKEKDFLVRSALKLNSKHADALNFYYYLRLLDACGLRKSAPLNTIYNNFVYRNGKPSLLIIGKGNKQRWAILPNKLYAEIIDYCTQQKLIGNDKVFDFNIAQVETMYQQVCRIAKHDDIERKGLIEKSQIAKHQQFAIKISYDIELSDGVKRKKSYYKPVYSLHKFRRFRAQYWYYKDDIPMVEIMYRLGHASLETTKIYISEGEESHLESWDESENKHAFEDKLYVESVERLRDSLQKQ